MMNNIVGSGVAGDELINDAKSLCSLPPKVLKVMAEVITEHWYSWVSGDENGETIRNLEKKVELFQKNRNLLERAIKVSTYILKQWVHRDLTREQVMGDLVELGISKEQKLGVEPLIDAMAQRIDQIREEVLKKSAFSIGLPEITSINCVCDLRAVFQSNKRQKLSVQDERYFIVRHLVPVVILEIMSVLNNTKKTHSFILNEKDLEELFDKLDRTRKRVSALKKYAEHLLSKGDTRL
jgi:hypothetical protein